jgi:demethylmenaquinone methyltransferase/2-methoxy-6-polyprenyl-1,4-benzoquinol methylase
MGNGERVIEFAAHEDRRENKYRRVWSEDLDDVFADVARYYDRANVVASLGLWHYFRRQFLDIIEIKSRQRVLDVCAGTNAIGIALLKKQSDLDVSAIDRSEAMQEVGREMAARQGFEIKSTIGDVHRLPFPDNYFDVVTLQFASRHLRIMDVVREIERVLKPGGHFYHSDMLRPANRIVETAYYAYLRVCLTVTAWLFRSNAPAVKCKQYFIHTLRDFYSAAALSRMLVQVGYENVTSKTIMFGMLGFHKATKACASGSNA